MIYSKIQKVFGTGNFNTLLLEVFAIFLGITASFMVDEWRQERQDQEAFERHLKAIYYETGLNQHQYRFDLYENNILVAVFKLLSGDVTTIPDGRLLGLVEAALSTRSAQRSDNSYQSLLTSGLVIPLDDTMRQLHHSFTTYRRWFEETEKNINDHNTMITNTFGLLRAVSNPDVLTWAPESKTLIFSPRLDQPEYGGVRQLFDEGENQLSTEMLAAQTRELLTQPIVRQALMEGIERFMLMSDGLLGMIGLGETIKFDILNRLPGIHVEVHTLSLIGSATAGGWGKSDATPFQPEDQSGMWWRMEVTLKDGMAKIIANNNYGTSWGVDYAWDKLVPLSNYTHYQGDPDKVFPTGIGQQDGQNIPVKAGRYLVRFNTHSLEYEFNLIGARD